VQAYCEARLAESLERLEGSVSGAHAWVEPVGPKSSTECWRATLAVNLEHGGSMIVHGEGEQAALAVAHAAQSARRRVHEIKQRARARARRRHAV